MNRAGTITIWTLVGIAIGLIWPIHMLTRENSFSSSAILRAHENPGRCVTLSPIHASLITTSLELPTRWDMADQHCIDKLRQLTEIVADEETVTIKTKHHNKVDARDIAHMASWLFRGMDHEMQLADRSGPHPEISHSDMITLSNVFKVEQDLSASTKEALGHDDYGQVAILAGSGNPQTTALWQNEDFQRRWNYLQNTPTILTGESGRYLPLLPLIEPALIADTPDANPFHLLLVKLTPSVGLLAGLAFGLIKSRKLPPVLPNIRQSPRHPGERSPNEW